MADESPDVDSPDVDADQDVDADTDAVADQPDEDADEDADEADAGPVRSEATDELWEEVGVAPIKIALPRDLVGYTLRAYRPVSQLTPTEAAPATDEDDDPFAARERARAVEDAELAGAEAELTAEAAAEEEAAGEDRARSGDSTAETEPIDAADDEPAEDEEEPADEEVPVFLSHRGKLLLFATPELLVSFVGSDATHDLAQLDTWTTLVKRVRPDDIFPTDDDTYELDLVVENLRGGHSAWDIPLLISAGELARDLGYALRLEPVVTALAAGSPLDDLDEALRAAAEGGVGGLFARRRLRRIGAQQASLGWRTIIGKISAVVDWRD